MDKMNVFDDTKQDEKDTLCLTLTHDTLQLAERKFVHLMIDKHNPNNMKKFRETSFISPTEYIYLFKELKIINSSQLSKTDDEAVHHLLFSNFIYKALLIARENFVNIKPLTSEDLDVISVLADLVRIQLGEAGIEVDRVVFDCSDVYMYQLIRGLFDYNPKLVEPLEYFANAENILSSFNPVSESEIYTYNYFKRCIKLGMNNTIDTVKIDFTLKGPLDLVAYGLYQYSSIISKGAYKMSPQLQLRNKRLYTNRIVTYFIYELTRAFVREAITTFNFGEELVHNANTALEIVGARFSELSLEKVYRDLLGEYDKFVIEIERWLKTLGNKSIVINYEDLAKAKELKLKIKELRTELWELKKEKIPEIKETELISKEQIKEEQEELKASKVISVSDKLRTIKDKSFIVITPNRIDTSVLSDNFKIINANEYKTKPVNLDCDYVVLLTTGLSHAIKYDVQSDMNNDKSKLLFSARTNIGLIIDDIIEQI